MIESSKHSCIGKHCIACKLCFVFLSKYFDFADHFSLIKESITKTDLLITTPQCNGVFTVMSSFTSSVFCGVFCGS